MKSEAKIRERLAEVRANLASLEKAPPAYRFHVRHLAMMAELLEWVLCPERNAPCDRFEPAAGFSWCKTCQWGEHAHPSRKI